MAKQKKKAVKPRISKSTRHFVLGTAPGEGHYNAKENVITEIDDRSSTTLEEITKHLHELGLSNEDYKGMKVYELVLVGTVQPPGQPYILPLSPKAKKK